MSDLERKSEEGMSKFPTLIERENNVTIFEELVFKGSEAFYKKRRACDYEEKLVVKVELVIGDWKIVARKEKSI